VSDVRLDGLLDAIRVTLREELRSALDERPGDVLDVAAVQARYGFADPRAARAVMHEAGAFPLGGRLFVQRDALERFERLHVTRPAAPAAHDTPRRQPRDPVPLRPGFWRE
jgi:hypothetical protein